MKSLVKLTEKPNQYSTRNYYAIPGLGVALYVWIRLFDQTKLKCTLEYLSLCFGIPQPLRSPFALKKK